MSGEPIYQQGDLFEDVDKVRRDTPMKCGKENSRNVKDAETQDSKTEALVVTSGQIPAVVDSIRIADVYSRDTSKMYYPAQLKQYTVFTDDNIVGNTTLSKENLRELNMLPEDEIDDEPAKNAKMVTVSEQVLSPIINKTGLTAYDRSVLEAIYSQLLAAEGSSNAIFTIRGIFRTMCGTQDSKISVSKSQQERIMKTVLRLMSTVVAVEVKGFAQGGEQASVTRWLPLVPAAIDRINIGGSVTTSVRITSYPEFLTYAHTNRGIAAVPLDMLHVPNLGSTERNMALISYLQHKLVAVTYDEEAESNRAKLADPNKLVIDYQTLYEIGEVKPLNKKVEVNKRYTSIYMHRIRDIVRSILDCWKEKGYINGYTEQSVKRNGAFISVTLEIPDTLPTIE